MSMRLAVVGTGGVARHNYLPYLAEQPDVTLGLYNRTPNKAREAATQCGGTVFDSIDDLAAWEPDAVFVLTRETDRRQAATALIQAGVKRLFFEKPLLAAGGQAHVSEEDFFAGRELLQLASRRGCETAMVFNYRFFESSAAARDISLARDFGEIINASVLSHYACWTHCIDLLHFFAGGVEEITALEGTRAIHSPDIDSTAFDVAAALRLENGASATLIGSAGLQWQHPLFELVLTFEHGRIHLRDLDGTMEVLDGNAGTTQTYRFGGDGSRWDMYAASFRKSLEAYLQSLREGAAPPVPGLEGLRELQVEAALKRSIAQGRPVRLNAEFSLDEVTSAPSPTGSIS